MFGYDRLSRRPAARGAEDDSKSDVQSGPTTRVCLVDDHPAIRQALARHLRKLSGMEVCGEAARSKEALGILETCGADVAVIDLALEDGSGIGLVKAIRKRRLTTQALVYSIYDEEVHAEQALRAGALGYLTKDASIETVVEAIRSASRGKVYLAAGVAEEVAGRAFGAGELSSTRLGVDRLTEREREVYRLVGEGLSIQEIAGRLDLSPKTVVSHRLQAADKLGLESVARLRTHAVRWRWAEAEPVSSGA